MLLSHSLLLLFTLISLHPDAIYGQYLADWDSLDNRTIPTWYDQAKIGIILTWGVYSVPSYLDTLFWLQWQGYNISQYVDFMAKNYPPTFTYADFGPQFTAEFFDASAWAALIKASGAKYVILTAKHQEGYTLWPSLYSPEWNSQEVGSKKDLVGLLAAAVRNETLRFGVYYALLEFFHPLYVEDKANHFASTKMTDLKVMPELKDLVERYEPDIIWSDGDFEASDEYWKSTEFLAWLYNESPVKDKVVVNDRWGENEIVCQHGDFLTCFDRYSPGRVLEKKWESVITLDKYYWAYRRDTKLEDIMSIEELLAALAQTISCGGNLLINVGPTKEGTIPALFQERLLQLGEWLEVNGEAIYESNPWNYAQNDRLTRKVSYTQRNGIVYAIVLNWPENEELYLGSVVELVGVNGENVVLEMLGYGLLTLNYDEAGILVYFPPRATVVGKWAWVLKFNPKQ